LIYEAGHFRLHEEPIAGKVSAMSKKLHGPNAPFVREPNSRYGTSLSAEANTPDAVNLRITRGKAWSKEDMLIFTNIADQHLAIAKAEVIRRAKHPG
jgi:hypothetical protein